MADVTVEYQGSALNQTPGIAEYNDGNAQVEVGQQLTVPEGVAKSLASDTDWKFVDADRFSFLGTEDQKFTEEERNLEEAAQNRNDLDAIRNPPVIDYGEGEDTQSGAGDSVPQDGTGSGGDVNGGGEETPAGGDENNGGGEVNE